MSKFTDQPGFPGDGDNNIELHHDAPVRWGKWQSIWSVVMVAAAILVAIVLVVMAVRATQ